MWNSFGSISQDAFALTVPNPMTTRNNMDIAVFFTNELPIFLKSYHPASICRHFVSVVNAISTIARIDHPIIRVNAAR
jgi:hypothetical protein